MKHTQAICPYCNGTGGMDSGGVTPWGSPIDIPCPCRDADDTAAEEYVAGISDKEVTNMVDAYMARPDVTVFVCGVKDPGAPMPMSDMRSLLVDLIVLEQWGPEDD